MKGIGIYQIKIKEDVMIVDKTDEIETVIDKIDKTEVERKEIKAAIGSKQIETPSTPLRAREIFLMNLTF